MTEGRYSRWEWTWYTESAGWMYCAGVESIPALRRHGETFELGGGSQRVATAVG